jgi:hypothetical protein
MTNTKKIFAISAVAVAAGVAAYTLMGEHGKKNRVKVAIWAKRMKADVVAKLKEMEAINEENYRAAIDMVKAKYQAMKNLEPQEVALLALQLKKHWSAVREDVKSAMPVKKAAAKPKKKKAATK